MTHLPSKPLGQLALKKSICLDPAKSQHRRNGMDAIEAYFFATPPDYEKFN